MLRALTLGLAVFCAGCAGPGPGYYWQAMSGQVELMWRARPVAEVERLPETSATVRERLALAGEIRRFASAELGLPDNGSYRRYANLERPYVAWNVFANPPLSMTPQSWCVPVAGCVNYLGFFSEDDAHALAARLRAQGMDVHVAGVPAYSTLGWFDDPLLNTFIQWSEPELARLIFHELAHQLLYVKHDTEFNESFAATVEEAGVRRWLAQPEHAHWLAAFEQSQARRDDFAALVLEYRDRLGLLYASGADEASLRDGKRRILDELKAAYAGLKAGRWQGFSGYDRWFAQDINNATLASIGLYRGLVPSFSAVLAEEHGDLPRFYARVRTLADLPAPQRRVALGDALQRASAALATHPAATAAQPRAPNL
ncbi:MAG: aminopeptidase [Rhodocyclaceae bacterium]